MYNEPSQQNNEVSQANNGASQVKNVISQVKNHKIKNYLIQAGRQKSGYCKRCKEKSGRVGPHKSENRSKQVILTVSAIGF